MTDVSLSLHRFKALRWAVARNAPFFGATNGVAESNRLTCTSHGAKHD
jgi:hypothetical protein